MGVKDLDIPSASFFNVNDKIFEDGTINRIEGSMNGPLSKFHKGAVRLCRITSRGGKCGQYEMGRNIDIAVIALQLPTPKCKCAEAENQRTVFFMSCRL